MRNYKSHNTCRRHDDACASQFWRKRWPEHAHIIAWTRLVAPTWRWRMQRGWRYIKRLGREGGSEGVATYVQGGSMERTRQVTSICANLRLRFGCFRLWRRFDLSGDAVHAWNLWRRNGVLHSPGSVSARVGWRCSTAARGGGRCGGAEIIHGEGAHQDDEVRRIVRKEFAEEMMCEHGDRRWRYHGWHSATLKNWMGRNQSISTTVWKPLLVSVSCSQLPSSISFRKYSQSSI